MDEFERIAVEILKKEVMEYLASQWTFLSYKVLNGFVSIIVGEIAKVVIKKTSIGIYFLKVNYEVRKESEAFISAEEKHSKALSLGDEEAIKKSEEELIKAAREFIKLR